jgi:hypothetical protein
MRYGSSSNRMGSVDLMMEPRKMRGTIIGRRGLIDIISFQRATRSHGPRLYLESRKI